MSIMSSRESQNYFPSTILRGEADNIENVVVRLWQAKVLATQEAHQILGDSCAYWCVRMNDGSVMTGNGLLEGIP